MRTVGAFLLSVLVTVQAAAYDHPLGSHAVHEAYFIGSSNYPKLSQLLLIRMFQQSPYLVVCQFLVSS